MQPDEPTEPMLQFFSPDTYATICRQSANRLVTWPDGSLKRCHAIPSAPSRKLLEAGPDDKPERLTRESHKRHEANGQKQTLSPEAVRPTEARPPPAR